MVKTFFVYVESRGASILEPRIEFLVYTSKSTRALHRDK
jgi:hypothetical protein